MGEEADEELRQMLKALLDSGLPTEWQQRAYASEDVNRIVARLQNLLVDDYAGRLKVAGFTSTPYQPAEESELEQSCSTCMYYVRSRQFCDLPELRVPVAPEWSCRLWRI